MICSCIDAVWEDDCNTFETKRHYTAKKNHVCNECNRVIATGERYEYIAAKYDGEFYSVKTCFDCVSMRDALFCTAYYGNIWCNVEEEIKEWVYNNTVPWAKLSTLTHTARERILEIIEEAYAEQEAL